MTPWTIEVTRVENNFAHLRNSVPYEARWILVDSREATVFGPFFGSPDEAESFATQVLNRLDQDDLAQAKADIQYLLSLRDAWRPRFQQSSINLDDGDELEMTNDGRGNWSISYSGPARVYYRTTEISATLSKVEELSGTTPTLLWQEVPTAHLKEYLTRHFLWEVGSPFVGGPLWLWRGGPTPDIPARVCHGDK